jgi:hypothetical protein
VGRTSKSFPRVCTWKVGLILCADPGAIDKIEDVGA